MDLDFDFLKALGVAAVFALRHLSREQGRQEAKDEASERRVMVNRLGDHEARLGALEQQARRPDDA